MTTDLIPVNVLIGDRSYRLRVNSNEEEQLRKTVKTINEKIIDFKTNFAGKDMQDYIAMVLLWFATDHEFATQSDIDVAAIKNKLSQIQEIIDKGLSRT